MDQNRSVLGGREERRHQRHSETTFAGKLRRCGGKVESSFHLEANTSFLLGSQWPLFLLLVSSMKGITSGDAHCDDGRRRKNAEFNRGGTKYQGTTIIRCNLHFNGSEWAKIQVHNIVVPSDTLARHKVQNKGPNAGHKKRYGNTSTYITFIYEIWHFHSTKIAMWSG